MECHSGSEPVECMLMCDKGYTADVDYFSQVFADCQGGNMYPPGPTGKGSKWKCVKGYCDHNKWKRLCYDHPMNKGQPSQRATDTITTDQSTLRLCNKPRFDP